MLSTGPFSCWSSDVSWLIVMIVYYDPFHIFCHARDEVVHIFFCVMPFVLLVMLVFVVDGKALSLSSSFVAWLIGGAMSI